MEISKCAWLYGALALFVVAACEESDESADAGRTHDPASHLDGAVNVPCPPSTPEFTEGLVADSEDGVLQARLIEAMPAPPEKYRNDWTIALETEDGTPLDDVDLSRADVLAWMPAHGHGGPPAAVTALSEPGAFDLEYLNLFMRGPWEVKIEAESASAGRDLLIFRVCVADD
jgi:hypothetical protein